MATALDSRYKITQMKNLEITVKTLFGFENILQDELFELGYKKTTPLNRAVQLTGDWEDVYRLNYRCRLAIAVLVKVKSFHLHKEDDLYKEAKKIDWPSFFSIDKTFAVKGAVFSTLFKHTQYPMLVVKDAIADVFRDRFGNRPNVNTKAPQVLFDLYVNDKMATISINTSGKPLFQRGYRQETGDAPMNEVLASGLIRLSGWDKKSTFIDPMCGSGTLAIEAALYAADIPAMIERSHFAFKNFTSFDAAAWEKVRKEGNQRPQQLECKIYASDIDAEMVNLAKRNSKMAPIGNMVEFSREDMLSLQAPDKKGVLICNPPYGERMGEEIEALYQNMGDAFKTNFSGYDCWVVSSNGDALKLIGLRPDKKLKVYNGKLECSFRKFSVFKGKRIDHLQEEEQHSEKPAIQKTAVTSPKKVNEKKPEKRQVKPREIQATSQRDSSPSSSKYSSSITGKNVSGKYGNSVTLHDGVEEKRAEKTEKPHPIVKKSKENTSLKAKIEQMKKRKY